MADAKIYLETGPKIESAGAVIRRVREEVGFSLSELADRVGMDKSSLSKYENDQLSMSLPVLDRIAEGLGIPPLVLLFECLKHRYPMLRRSGSKIGGLVESLVSELTRNQKKQAS